MSQMVQIHGQLRDMILSLDIGPGERLTERWLEGRFQGSRTPVRAALVRLEAEGLVQRDGRNWIVAPIDLGEIDDQNYARTVTVTGTVFGGGTLTASIVMDGIFNGPAAGNDAQDHAKVRLPSRRIPPGPYA